MLETKTLDINGRTYTIGQMPAAAAFEVGCIVAEWRGKVLGAMGDAALHSLDAPIDAVAGAGRSISMVAKMLRDPEYKRGAWEPSLAVCSYNGTPVLKGAFDLEFAGDRLADLYELHNASIAHSCGGFLKGLGLGAVQSPQV